MEYLDDPNKAGYLFPKCLKTDYQTGDLGASFRGQVSLLHEWIVFYWRFEYAIWGKILPSVIGLTEHPNLPPNYPNHLIITANPIEFDGFYWNMAGAWGNDGGTHLLSIVNDYVVAGIPSDSPDWELRDAVHLCDLPTYEYPTGTFYQCCDKWGFNVGLNFKKSWYTRGAPIPPDKKAPFPLWHTIFLGSILFPHTIPGFVSDFFPINQFAIPREENR
jgi:hypothetical protein